MSFPITSDSEEAINPDLLALAQKTQASHQKLIDEARRLTTTEARRSVRNKLDQLQQSFTAQAMELTGVETPSEWAGSTNADYVIAYSVQRDIADTEARLSNLAAGEALQKAIVSSFKYDKGSGGPPGPTIPTWLKWAVGLYVGARLLEALKK